MKKGIIDEFLQEMINLIWLELRQLQMSTWKKTFSKQIAQNTTNYK